MHRSVLLTVFIIGIIVLSSFLLEKHFNITSYFFSDTHEVKKAPDKLPSEPSEKVPDKLTISTEPPETLKLSEITELRHMLQNEQFEQLNTVLEEYQNLFEKDQTDEYKVNDAYNSFYLTVSSQYRSA
ncbi:MAG: hypothetical protein GY793_02880 [Proteobacteria bacterium]|nr:hypothetical protein [Pseudomonadota bacterium]